MKGVRQKDTAPEVAVRRCLHAHGLRYSLHRRDLPGRPDIVLPKRRTVVFVHGCFWHAHDCAHGTVAAKRNADFWAEKLSANRARDLRVQEQLRRQGWHVEVVWECQASDRAYLGTLTRRLLSR
jgi:DNA mismatch endonuclease (patch repair protein)